MSGSACAGVALESPVLFLLYNRPVLTKVVFERIAEARPSKLLVVADGPHPDRPGDVERCQAARQAVFDRIDWPCEVHTDLSERNLGRRVRTVTALDWALDQFDRVIFVEDDILLDPTFFRYADEMLRHYQSDERVMNVTGFNQVPGGWKADRQHYHFSGFPSLWGFATWRRAWRHYDGDMKLLASEDVRKRVADGYGNPHVASFWLNKWDKVTRGEIDTWDYQWIFACRLAGALSVVPAVNLVTNIGHHEQATYAKRWNPITALPVGSLTFPMHPHEAVAVDHDYDLRAPSVLRSNANAARLQQTMGAVR